MSDQVINPFENNKNLNNIDPFSKTPEQEKKYEKLKKNFKEKYNTDLEKLFGEISPENIGKINGNYQNNGGDFKKALEAVLSSFPLEYKDKKDLEWLIIFYIEKNKKANNKENLELNDNFLKKEHPFIPILERYLEIGVLTKKEVDSIIDNIKDNGGANIDATEAIENSSLSPNKKKNLLDVNNYLIKKEIKQEKDIKNGKDIKIPDIFKQYEALSNKNDDIIQLISIHYIPIKDKNGEINNKKDIDTAISKATNDVIFGKVFNRDKMIFKNNLNIIKGNYSIKEKVDALRKIVSFVNNNQGKKGKSILKQKEYFENVENVDKFKNLSLEEMEIKIKELLKRAKDKTNKKLQEELETIKKAKKGEQIESGDVFSGGQKDSATKTNETQEQK